MTQTDIDLVKIQNQTARNHNLEKNSPKIFGYKIESILNFLWYFVVILIISLALTKYFIVQQVTVVGDSMQNNFHTGQNLLVNQIDSKYQRGDVVAVYSDEEVGCHTGFLDKFSPKFLLKRIIGLPGESIEIIGARVIIYNSQNPEGIELVEDYVSPTNKLIENNRGYKLDKTLIAKDSYFVMGDNRPNSYDSRNLGSFKECAIMGKVIYRIWPLEDFGSIG